MFAIGEGENPRGALETLLFGRPFTFEIYTDAPIAVEAPIAYQRAQYICEVAKNWYYLPKIQAVWNVPEWTLEIQRKLEAMEEQPYIPHGHAWCLPHWVPAERYKPHPLWGFV